MGIIHDIEVEKAASKNNLMDGTAGSGSDSPSAEVTEHKILKHVTMHNFKIKSKSIDTDNENGQDAEVMVNVANGHSEAGSPTGYLEKRSSLDSGDLGDLVEIQKAVLDGALDTPKATKL